MSTTIHSRLRLPLPPLRVAEALTDQVPLGRWFARNAPSLGVVEPQQQWGLRGAYHFWSRFSPDPPPALLTTLTDLAMPTETDPRVRMRYLWNLRGTQTTVELELAPLGAGALLSLQHHGLAPLAEDPLGGAAYWRIVLENLRLYLLGQDGLAWYDARRLGQLEVGLSLAAPGLPATAAAWELLTTPAGLGRIWGGAASVDPRLGGSLSFGWSGGGPGEIVAFEPPGQGSGIVEARLGTRWQLAGDPLPTVVTWSLSGRDSATRLTIVHSGFSDASEPYRDTWRAMLGRMGELLDGGEEWDED